MPIGPSVIIVSRNEADRLRRTVLCILDHLPQGGEIIVVDDCSSDGSADNLQVDERVSVLRAESHNGAPAGRNWGAAQATKDVIVFCDAHVSVPVGWFSPLASVLRKSRVAAVGPTVCDMADPTAKGYGLGFIGPSLDWAWLPPQGTRPYPVPLLGAGFLAMRRDVFNDVGGFDEGLIIYGMEDSELCLRLWLLGYECWIVPEVEVQHRSHPPDAEEPRYYDDCEIALHNTLRVGLIHLTGDRLRDMLAAHQEDPSFPGAFVRAVESDVWTRRKQLLPSRIRDDAAYLTEYGWAFP